MKRKLGWTDAADRWERENLGIVISRCLTPTRHGYFVPWARTLAFKQWLVRERVCVCVSVFTEHTHSRCMRLWVSPSAWMLFACSINHCTPVFYPAVGLKSTRTSKVVSKDIHLNSSSQICCSWWCYPVI